MVRNPLEEWREVVGFEGRYLVSNCGHIRSLLRPSKLRTLSVGRGGYLFVCLVDAGGTQHYVSVARAVCRAFHGPCPAGMNCDHQDSNKTNNHVDNLRWLCEKENVRRAHLGKPSKRKKAGEVFKAGIGHWFPDQSAFCRSRGLNEGNLSSVLTGRRPHHKGYYS